MLYKHNSELTQNAKSLRKNMTKEERKLWYGFLRDYPVKFLRQKILGKYIVDFYCAKAKLVIELDGSQHYLDEQKAYDEERTEFLSGYQIKVVRFLNGEVVNNFNGICEYINIIVHERIACFA